MVYKLHSFLLLQGHRVRLVLVDVINELVTLLVCECIGIKARDEKPTFSERQMRPALEYNQVPFSLAAPKSPILMCFL